jgi:hypothetical protein
MVANRARDGRRAIVANATVKRFETGTGAKVSADAVEKMRRALEAAGVEFIPENGGGAGVRFKKSVIN